MSRLLQVAANCSVSGAGNHEFKQRKSRYTNRERVLVPGVVAALPIQVSATSSHIRATVAFIFIALGVHCEPARADSPNVLQAECQRPLVVVNYFAGWWKGLPNKWHGRGWNDQEPDWRPD